MSIKMKHLPTLKKLPKGIFNFVKIKEVKGIEIFRANFNYSIDEIKKGLSEIYSEVEIEQSLAMLINFGGFATEFVSADNTEFVGICVKTDYYAELNELIDHEIIHVNQIKNGQLVMGEKHIIWKGEKFDVERSTKISTLITKIINNNNLKFDIDETFLINQMVLPWEWEAYQTTYDNHPHISDFVKKIKDDVILNSK